MKLVLDRCTACGHVCNFRRVACPRCLAELEPVEALGLGTIVSYSIVHRWTERFREHLPIVLVVVELAEGVEIVSSLVGEDALDVAIGDDVRVTDRGWSTLPQFERVVAR